MFETGWKIVVPVAARDYQAVRRMIQAAMPAAGVAKPAGGREEYIWNSNLASMHRGLADAQYNLKDYAEAEKSIRSAMAYTKLLERTLDRQRDAAKDQVLLAMILVRLDRHADAQQTVAPALQFQRGLYARSQEDLNQRIELAQALYASALAGGTQRAAAAKEAAALVDGLPPAMRQLKSTVLLRERIAEEQTKPSA
jgi:tetratricopeptide (TPR) repeat protein